MSERAELIEDFKGALDHLLEAGIQSLRPPIRAQAERLLRKGGSIFGEINYQAGDSTSRLRLALRVVHAEGEVNLCSIVLDAN